MIAPGVLRVVEREARVFRRLWRASAFSSLVQPLLYLAAIGVGLGRLVDRQTGAVDGLGYLVFVSPGLLAASAMQTAAGNSLWPVMAGIKWVRSYHAMVATPLRPGDVFGGFLVWNTLRAGLFAAAFLAVAALLGGIPSAWGILAVPAAMLCAAAFAGPLSAFAATQEVDAAFPVILRLGILPLFLFSATFFPLGQLPSSLRWIAVVSPLWHGVVLCRDATTGSLRLLPSLGHVAVLLACIGAGWAWGVRTFSRKLAP